MAKEIRQGQTTLVLGLLILDTHSERSGELIYEMFTVLII